MATVAVGSPPSRQTQIRMSVMVPEDPATTPTAKEIAVGGHIVIQVGLFLSRL